MTRRALMLIDLQNDYYPGGKWPLDGIAEASANAARLLAAFRATGETVIHVRHENPAPDARFFAVGTEGARIRADLAPAPGEAVVIKNFANAFRDTNLKTTLDAAAVETLTICGAMSHMCVDATVRAAADQGFAVTVIHDACATRALAFGGVNVPAPQVHAAFMAALSMGYAQMTATGDWLAEPY